jgi:SAM-dependent methyltransferase
MMRLLDALRGLVHPRPLPTIPHGEAGIRQVGHREYVGGLWDEIGRLQFSFLVAHGLRPEHVLLDVGCGCLRGGVHFIPYLEPEHYLGIDKEPSLIAAGLERELPPKLRAVKRPRLLVSADFAFADFGVPIDYALAQSLFTHLPPAGVARCLERLRPCLRPQGRFLATFHEVPRAVPNPQRPHDHDYFAYTRAELEELADRCDWRAEYLGDWNHPRGQKMMLFHPRW